MDQSPEVNTLLTAAPRHLRRRALHKEIPDTLLVPGAPPVVAPPSSTGGRAPFRPVKPRSSNAAAAARSYRRKRFVALGLTIFVAISVLCLAVALVLYG